MICNYTTINNLKLTKCRDRNTRKTVNNGDHQQKQDGHLTKSHHLTKLKIN